MRSITTIRVSNVICTVRVSNWICTTVIRVRVSAIGFGTNWK